MLPADEVADIEADAFLIAVPVPDSVDDANGVKPSICYLLRLSRPDNGV